MRYYSCTLLMCIRRTELSRAKERIMKFPKCNRTALRSRLRNLSLYFALCTFHFALPNCDAARPPGAPPPSTQPQTRGDKLLDSYFENETAAIAGRCLTDVK